MGKMETPWSARGGVFVIVVRRARLVMPGPGVGQGRAQLGGVEVFGSVSHDAVRLP